MKLNIPEMEKSILEYWKENDFFTKSVEMRSADKSFVFYDGPPFATGLPHHGSLLASVIKDMIPRYKTMRGYRVERVWGWDCHGLPIENLVEQDLGLNSKKDIESLGVGKFTNACRASVLKYDREWKTYVDRVGRWIDFDNSYKTMDNNYIESVWWGFKQVFDKGLAYEGRHISLYCPRCSTPLSNFEIAMDNSYKDVEDHSTFVKFKVKGEENVFFLAWTTTPWTLPGNTGLVVDVKADYVLVEMNGEKYYLAKDLVEKVFPAEPDQPMAEGPKIVEELKGEGLLGKEYEPLFTFMDTEGKKAYYVMDGDFVSLEDGTGIVHTASVYGEDDYKLAQEKDLPRVGTLDDAGKFIEGQSPFGGMFFKKSEKYIIDDLEKRGLLLRDEPYTHSYPFCWRCSTPLYYNAVPAWFINVQKIKARMLELNEDINWYPNHLKEGRFKYGLENAPDWNISRNRYWGSPIPVWQCDSCEAVEVVGSIKEIADKSNVNENDIADVHLPAIDQYHWDCSACEGKMKRVSQVFDCWVESGSMPFASLHYPFENKDKFEANFPGEFIAEYIAQTRGWFYTLHVLATAIFDKPTFVNALTTGTIQAKDGQKMSKSKKNYTDPLNLFDQFGADAFRYYLMASPVMSAENLSFSDDGVKDVMRKVVMLLTNIHGLYEMYSGASHQMPSADELKAMKLTSLDKWMLARWSAVHEEVTNDLDNYNVVRPGRVLIEFINDFSTWYLRRSRDRFKGTDNDDKAVALATTRYVLEQLLLVLAPYTPFITEHLYQKMYPEQKKSIHLQDWPEGADWMKDENLLNEMGAVRQIVEAALAVRAEAEIKIRQVCETLLVKLPSGLKSLDAFEGLLKEELNLKSIKAVGSIEEQKGYIVKEGNNVTVALKTELSEELLKEGLARDLVRQINNLRKNGGLSIEDRVTVQYQTDSDFVESVFTQFEDDLKRQTLTDAFLPESPKGDSATLKFHEHEVVIGVKKV